MNITVSLLLAKAIKTLNDQRVGHEAATSRYYALVHIYRCLLPFTSIFDQRTNMGVCK